MSKFMGRFGIEFTRRHALSSGADREDLQWTRLIQTYATEELAEQELRWLELEDDQYVYRVVWRMNE